MKLTPFYRCLENYKNLTVKIVKCKDTDNTNELIQEQMDLSNYMCNWYTPKWMKVYLKKYNNLKTK